MLGIRVPRGAHDRFTTIGVASRWLVRRTRRTTEQRPRRGGVAYATGRRPAWRGAPVAPAGGRDRRSPGLRRGHGLPVAVGPGAVGGGRLGDGDRPLALDVEVGQ